MNAQTLVQKVWNFATVLRDDGVSYGDYVEQLTYLLFLKMAQEREELDAALGRKVEARIPKALAWPSLLRLDGDDLENHYRKVLQELGHQPGLLGTIFRKAQNKLQDPAKLKRLVMLIDAESWSGLDADVKGEIYEGLLERNARDVKSGAGQYFTPRPLIKAIVEVMDPNPGLVVADPACGTGGFLIAAHDHMAAQGPLTPDQARHLRERAFRGADITTEVARLCAMNLHLHGIGGEDSLIEGGRDSLASPPSVLVDMVLTNPPFGKKSSITVVGEDGKAQKESLTYERADFVTTTSNKQLNFLQHVKSILKPGSGRAAVVVPDNVLFEGGAGETIRRKLLHECDVHTLLRLPTGIFYAQGVKANVLFFDRKPGAAKPWTEKLWIYDLRTNLHFTLKENPLGEEHLRDFVACYQPKDRKKRKESERFRVFDREALLARDKANLDLFWIKDEDLEASENLPAPDVLAREIVEDLEAALEAFSSVEEGLASDE
ncbi:class I SAM-dependent DNA methyltransferase [Geothrix sp. 21YS21S-4]|uniref:type I restriction-modification system subunit M n=1 Tax=Geothrix sp. 21YS21S-4 TaxID=3068889 RepID=UPI0027B9FD6D|nr:class I SAM-dependent DNA methyltransferase [Geothrix sp. 21YS21S-4]